MAKHGKKYLAAAAKIDENRWYKPDEAVKLVKETHYVNFDSTVEIHMRLGVDPRHADQQVRDRADIVIHDEFTSQAFQISIDNHVRPGITPPAAGEVGTDLKENEADHYREEPVSQVSSR